MKKRTGRLPSYLILFDAIIAILLAFIALNGKVRKIAPFYKEKLEASKLAYEMFQSVKEFRIKLGLPMDSLNDPMLSGLIGVQLSPITTEYGDLTSKITSINPNFSALFVSYLKRLHLKEGDVVAVHLTGSFPALNICLFSTLKTLKLNPIIITSVGASMRGANIPNFTVLDIENYLRTKNLIPFKTAYASYGGIDDLGRGLPEEGREIIEKDAEKNAILLIKAKSLSESMKRKFEIYTELSKNNPIKCFINIGGNAAVVAGVDVPSGIIDYRYANHPGLIGEFLRRGILVINVQNVAYLARRHGFPVSPAVMPSPGEGKLFYEARYSVPLAIICLLILVLILAFTFYVDVDYYVKKITRRV